MCVCCGFPFFRVKNKGLAVFWFSRLWGGGGTAGVVLFSLCVPLTLTLTSLALALSLALSLSLSLSLSLCHDKKMYKNFYFFGHYYC